MPESARSKPASATLLAMATLLVSMGATAAPASSKPGTHPTPKLYQCAGQLTRPADHIITMEANKTFYKVTDSTAPVITQPQMDPGYPITATAAKTKTCKRRVVEIRVPSTTSSGCATCYPNAEINACAGSFSGSKEFEEHCRVPTSSTAEATCKTFNHPVEVYLKKSGETEFNKVSISHFLYNKGFVDVNGCRVAAKNLGQIYDTAEVWPNVLPPASGTDVYRVLSLPTYKGALVDTVIFVEFNSKGGDRRDVRYRKVALLIGRGKKTAPGRVLLLPSVACKGLPQSRILALELFEPTDLGVNCRTVLRFPRTKCRPADAVIPAHFHDRCSRRRLAEETDDLPFRKSRLHRAPNFSWRT
jgi:hypothetical protein